MTTFFMPMDPRLSSPSTAATTLSIRASTHSTTEATHVGSMSTDTVTYCVEKSISIGPVSTSMARHSSMATASTLWEAPDAQRAPISQLSTRDGISSALSPSAPTLAATIALALMIISTCSPVTIETFVAHIQTCATTTESQDPPLALVFLAFKALACSLKYKFSTGMHNGWRSLFMFFGYWSALVEVTVRWVPGVCLGMFVQIRSLWKLCQWI